MSGAEPFGNPEFLACSSEDDASVASGFFSVQVRPWDVGLSGR
jgi:hypothetical protein